MKIYFLYIYLLFLAILGKFFKKELLIFAENILNTSVKITLAKQDSITITTQLDDKNSFIFKDLHPGLYNIKLKKMKKSYMQIF